MRTKLYRLFALLLALSLYGIAAAQELLPPEVAFKFSARALDASTLELRYQIADGYYMYRDKFKFAVEPDTVKLGSAQFPHGDVHNDEYFGKVETYRKELRIRLPLAQEAAGEKIKLKVTSQGCADAGVCYVPQEQTAQIQLPAAGSAAAASPTVDAAAQGAGNDEARFQRLLASGSLWLIAAAFFGAGILLTFTPCVLPMIPILSGIIVGEGRDATRTRAFTLSLAYVLGMSVTYTAIGVGAALSGSLLSAALQNPWVLSAFAAVFVLLSLSMFGFYELQLPAALQSRVSNTANRQGGSLSAIGLMGALSSLIVGPCVAAPLAGALLYIAQTGNAALGGAALFVMSLGMGAPLLLVGAFSRSLLPKSGPWMEGIKKFFGVVMLATALWLVSPVVPLWLQMLGWALLMVIPAIYLHALDPLPPHAHGWQRLGKGLGVILLLGGAAMLIGVLGGARDPLQPLGFLRAGASTEAPAPTFERVVSVAALDTRLAQAKAAGKPVMLDFYADWCVSCKEMERFTFADPQVASRMKQLVLLQADVTANNAADLALLKRFGLFGPPGIIFFDGGGRELVDLRVVGFQSAEQFLPTLERVLR